LKKIHVKAMDVGCYSPFSGSGNKFLS